MNRMMLFSIFIFTPIFVGADLSIKEMNAMVTKIRDKRVGLNIESGKLFVSPFVILKREENATQVKLESPKVKSVAFKLGAIINNEAFINNTWVAKDNEINGYKVVQVNSDSATLQQDTHRVKLFLKKSKPIFTLIGSN